MMTSQLWEEVGKRVVMVAGVVRRRMLEEVAVRLRLLAEEEAKKLPLGEEVGRKQQLVLESLLVW
jgi:hypothetical protein